MYPQITTACVPSSTDSRNNPFFSLKENPIKLMCVFKTCFPIAFPQNNACICSNSSLHSRGGRSQIKEEPHAPNLFFLKRESETPKNSESWYLNARHIMFSTRMMSFWPLTSILTHWSGVWFWWQTFFVISGLWGISPHRFDWTVREGGVRLDYY